MLSPLIDKVHAAKPVGTALGIYITALIEALEDEEVALEAVASTVTHAANAPMPFMMLKEGGCR